MEKNDFCVCSMIQSISLPLPPLQFPPSRCKFPSDSQFLLQIPFPSTGQFFFSLWLCEILSEWRYGYLLSSLSYDTTSFHSFKGGLDWCHCGSVCGSAPTSHCIGHCCVHSCMWQKEQKICVDKNESIQHYHRQYHCVLSYIICRYLLQQLLWEMVVVCNSIVSCDDPVLVSFMNEKSVVSWKWSHLCCDCAGVNMMIRIWICRPPNAYTL